MALHIDPLAVGSNGGIYAATFCGQQVVAKTIHMFEGDNPRMFGGVYLRRERDSAFQKLEILRNLAVHPNVLSPLAVYTRTMKDPDIIGPEIRYPRFVFYPRCEANLSQFLAAGTADTETMRRLALGMCAGVFHFARNGIVHRDLKLENILVHHNDALLCDFDLMCSAVDRESNGK